MLGDLIYDLLAKTEGPVAFGTDTFAPIRAVAGGSGANAAAWLAASGVETHFVGRVGDDAFGAFLAGEMERAGVTPHLAVDPDLPTGKVFVLVDGAGERTMITDRGAGDALTPEDVPEALLRGEAPGGHLHLSGYAFSNEGRRGAALKASRLARGSRMTVSVDPSSAPLLEAVGPGNFLAWTRDAHLCFPNLEEGALLAGKSDPDAAARALLSSYKGVVLKLGPEGALYAGADPPGGPPGTPVHEPAAPARVVDTTGAGDALCAGFLSAWLSGGAPQEALAKGVGLAARAVGRIGGRPAGRGGSGLTDPLGDP